MVSGTRNASIDVYVRNTSDDDAVRAWAQAHQIQAKQLGDNALTLNRDEGLWQRLHSRSSNNTTEEVPIYLKRNGQFFQLRSEDLGL